ncbi:NitT/TauT family transport system substrate-binding protein [Halogranum amylolyticum]|uniref:Thiamine pyrimidine synthase n=1 Tax=Halogranum amylolyticum TaxID=660520 RepID=A0A1H8TIS1_9EURY|nr:ABC transporter substrate-binding protein [Halogranum amylolyticum]SEO90715.1 NitT/TauT family transport system substrate-binding protein [Halogranum amylolyticum]
MAIERREFLVVSGTALAAGCTGMNASDGTGGSTDGGATATDAPTGTETATASPEPTPSVTDVSLLLNWKPSGLHVPYYAAAAQGFYEAEGLNLQTIEAGQGSDFSAKQTGLGNTEFAITSSDQVLNVNSRELSPLSVGVVMQKSPVVVFSTRETFGSELTDPAQLAGKTVGTGPGMVRLLTELYLEQTGVRSDVEMVDTGYDTVQQLLAGKIDVAGGVFGDAIAARAQGGTTDSLQVANRVPAYGHVVATNADFADEHPATVTAFLRATARGAVWGRNNVEAAMDTLVDANGALAESRDQQREKWLTMADDHMLSDTVREQGWGWSEGDPWQTTAEALRSAEQLGGQVNADDVWTNAHLETESKYIDAYADLVSN